MTDPDLLRPSLRADAARAPVYSVGALIAAAFFGGAPAVPIIAFVNSRRQGRIGRDIVWIVAAAIASVGVIVYAAFDAGIEDSREARRTVRLISRGAGFVLVAGFYLLHKDIYRSQSMLGIDPPKPYAIVIMSILVSIFLTVVIIQSLLFGLAGGSS